MQINIVVFGKNKEIVETLNRVINNNAEWKAFCAYEQNDLEEILQLNPINIILYSSGIGEEETIFLEKWMNENYPNIKQIHHYGGGSGLLLCEINSALSEGKVIRKARKNHLI